MEKHRKRRGDRESAKNTEVNLSSHTLELLAKDSFRSPSPHRLRQLHGGWMGLFSRKVSAPAVPTKEELALQEAERQRKEEAARINELVKRSAEVKLSEAKRETLTTENFKKKPVKIDHAAIKQRHLEESMRVRRDHLAAQIG